MNNERLLKVLLQPVITEKTAGLGESSNQVVFKVLPGAEKREIKAAVEKLFGVEVLGVRVVNAKGKTRRTRTGLGKCSDWKKAYVRLAPGQDIDFTTV
ncbi:MAG TPA: 50S ribosomal protein L23 [Porticoccaceae bacterium]|nr:50S ribosomal protein L23 [Porticoccaceae bacterium]HCO58706.1 50S ribosomal protein L23 [Porticoccaceae bacterium]